MFLHFAREGEAPADPLTANGSPGGSPSHMLTKTPKDFRKLAYQLQKETNDHSYEHYTKSK